jgi:transaldolase
MDPSHRLPGALTAERGPQAAELRIKIFADGADVAACRELYANPLIQGFTTNPTHMHKAGVRDYERFARELLDAIPDRPISFEVFSDELAEMERQARLIASWGEHVYVKIPVTNTQGLRTDGVQRTLAGEGVKQNVTGLMTLEQVAWVSEALEGGPPAVVSVFAGRIADAGVDPVPVMATALDMLGAQPDVELLWASPRELLNIVQADRLGVDIITVTHDLLKKLPSLGRDLDEFSLATVQMFRDDAVAAGFALEAAPAPTLEVTMFTKPARREAAPAGVK